MLIIKITLVLKQKKHKEKLKIIIKLKIGPNMLKCLKYLIKFDYLLTNYYFFILLLGLTFKFGVYVYKSLFKDLFLIKKF